MAKIHINNPKQVINGGAKKYYFKIKGLGGPKGDKGDTGATGPQGPQGPQGNAATVSVGSTTTLPVGYDATVTNTGSIYNAVLNFGIPQGPRGPQGATGATGAKGDKGDQGNPGPQGEKGTNATVYVGTTSTLNPGSQATVYNSGTDSNAVLNFGIPKGEKGDTGPMPTIAQTTGQATDQVMSQKATTDALNTKQATITSSNKLSADLVTDTSTTNKFVTAEDKTTWNGKQDALTAGTGIDITSGIISTPAIVPEVVTELPTTGAEGKLYLTPKAHTTQTATGNPIEATITAQAGQLESFQLDGDTFQQSYTGKNLYNNEAIPYLAKRAYDSDGAVLSWADYAGTNEYQPVEPNTQYTLWNDKIGNITYLCEYDENKNFIQRLVAVKTFTTTATTKYLRWSLNVGTGEIPPTKTQLELGSTTTSYEPFVGGQPSPSPAYPQQIQTVTGDQTVSVVTSLITTDTELENSRLNSNGTINLNISNRLCCSDYIEVKPNTTYRFSVSSGDSSKTIQAYFVGYALQDNTGIGAYPNGANWANPPFSITTDSNCNYVKVGMRYSDDSDITPNDISEIEFLTTATTYPISLGSIELCKLGTYQDYIYKDGEDWKIHKSVKKVAPTGEESYSFYESMTRFSVSGVKTGQTAGIISTHFTREYANNEGKCYVSTNNLIAMGIPNISTEAQAQAWVSANRPEFYCELSTPTDTTITDQTLIAQLEAIRTASLQNGANTITNTATGSNLAGDMEIGYYGFNPRNRYDKFIWLNLNNNYEQIGGE